LQCDAPLTTPLPSLSLLEAAVNLSTPQLRQADAPVPVWCFPGSQTSQLESPCALLVPAGHTWQNVAPVEVPADDAEAEAEVKLPAPHALHALLSSDVLNCSAVHVAQVVS
jgi:hypothetical protein